MQVMPAGDDDEVEFRILEKLIRCSGDPCRSVLLCNIHRVCARARGDGGNRKDLMQAFEVWKMNGTGEVTRSHNSGPDLSIRNRWSSRHRRSLMAGG